LPGFFYNGTIFKRLHLVLLETSPKEFPFFNQQHIFPYYVLFYPY
jgi:hypothetical protein